MDNNKIVYVIKSYDEGLESKMIYGVIRGKKKAINTIETLARKSLQRRIHDRPDRKSTMNRLEELKIRIDTDWSYSSWYEAVPVEVNVILDRPF